MPSPLLVVPFSVALSDFVAGFSCGEAPHERELADWIRQDALPAMQRGTSVWLFLTAGRELIGYGSLGKTN